MYPSLELRLALPFLLPHLPPIRCRERRLQLGQFPQSRSPLCRLLDNPLPLRTRALAADQDPARPNWGRPMNRPSHSRNPSRNHHSIRATARRLRTLGNRSQARCHRRNSPFRCRRFASWEASPTDAPVLCRDLVPYRSRPSRMRSPCLRTNRRSWTRNHRMIRTDTLRSQTRPGSQENQQPRHDPASRTPIRRNRQNSR